MTTKQVFGTIGVFLLILSVIVNCAIAIASPELCGFDEDENRLFAVQHPSKSPESNGCSKPSFIQVTLDLNLYAFRNVIIQRFFLDRLPERKILPIVVIDTMHVMQHVVHPKPFVILSSRNA